MKTKFFLARACKGLLVFAVLLLSQKDSFAQPGNDLCSNATTLTPGTTCVTTAGTLKNATATAGIAVNCGSASSPDVWYNFTATSSYPIITLSGYTISLSSIARMQLFSGTCTSLTSLACVSGTSLNVASVIGGAGLTVGSVYYVRIYTSSAAAITSNSYGFNICITNASTPTVDYGKSYVNVTKGTNGGTVEPGDTLEIRATFVVKANSAYNCSFTDNIPANSTYIPGTLRVLTNEGKIYQQFTDAAGDDAGTYTGSSITINMGSGATSSNGGIVSSTSKPSFYGSTCIMVASYRVVIPTSLAYGSTVNVGNGTLSYNNAAGNVAINFPAYTILVFKNYGICSNTVGTNALINEFGGTFGSGTVKDRYASNKVPSNYTYTTFSSSAGMPQDYYYGVSNNTSGGTTTATGYATVNTYAKPDNSSPSHRIFGVWDIIGDHTGAASSSAGNPATDDLNGASGGYMLVINSSYRTDTAYLDTVYNLCPNTYYQYTGWFRNMCSLCGCDSFGRGATTSGYIPTATGDSSGVHPNLTFNVNGYDYYTTGNMLYTGTWVQKGFTYLTGAAQTTMVISIRNNAPGGGGNDWALDDVGVATCSPNMTLTPNKPDTVCMGTTDSVKFLVTSFFNNYAVWELQVSSDGGTTWAAAGPDTAGNLDNGTATPVYNSTTGQYQYYVTRYYKLGTTYNEVIYRLIVASTTTNLSNSSCNFVTMSPKIIYAVNCLTVLPTNIISFAGQLKNGLGNLQWVTSNETDGITYTVQRSDDGKNFTNVGTVKGQAPQGMGSTYNFVDPNPVSTQSYYRILVNSSTYQGYSNEVLLSSTGFGFAEKSVINPFVDHITVDLTTPGDGNLQVNLVDMYGRRVKQLTQPVTQGLNNMTMYGLGGLTTGTYILQLQYNDKIITNKMVKLAN